MSDGRRRRQAKQARRDARRRSTRERSTADEPPLVPEIRDLLSRPRPAQLLWLASALINASYCLSSSIPARGMRCAGAQHALNKHWAQHRSMTVTCQSAVSSTRPRFCERSSHSLTHRVGFAQVSPQKQLRWLTGWRSHTNGKCWSKPQNGAKTTVPMRRRAPCPAIRAAAAQRAPTPMRRG